MNFYHSLCFKDSERSRNSIYTEIDEYLSQGWGVIYVADSDVAEMVRQMAKSGIDIEGYIESGSLMIISSIYSVEKTEFDADALLNNCHELILKLKKKGFEKILVVGSLEPFFESGDYTDKLIKYELAVGERFQTSLEAIVCCYDRKTADRLATRQIIALLNAHQFTLHDGWVYQQWDSDRILQIISAALDKSLGQSTSKLVLKALKSVYKYDGKTIVSKPELWESSLRRFFGDSADSILNILSSELRRETAYSKCRLDCN
jgi:hypothetical protein